MKLITILQIFVFVLTFHLFSQDNATTTPEYEATRQTEKLQQELNLSSDQIKLVYEINLKYARARQNSTSRSEAMQRIKSKDAELEKVLSDEQINKLHTKRYERSVYQPNQSESFRSTESTPKVNPHSLRSSAIEMRTRQSEQRRTQKQPPTTIETRRATPASTNRSESASPSRNENSSPARNTQTQPSAPARREQSAAPQRIRESSSQSPSVPIPTRRR